MAYVIVFIDILSITILLTAFLLLWKERGHFFSLKPLLPAVVLVTLGHLSDLVLEHLVVRPTFFPRISASTYEMVMVMFGNITDVLGAGLLILGFIKIIKHEKEEEKHIHDLESLLPICSNCKKYRTGEGEWMPIEKYLIDSGAPRLTHGICPECSEKLYGDYLKGKRK